MDYTWVRKNLPTSPRKELLDWARDHVSGELGDDYLLHYAKRVKLAPSFGDLLEFNGHPPSKSIWASQCLCTNCQEEFLTQKIAGLDAIRVYTGEDSLIYPADPGVEYCGYEGYIIDVFDGDSLTCPYCCTNVQLLHSRKVRGGRKKQIMVVSIENIGSYTAIISWLLSRTISEYGYSAYSGIPADAYVLKEDGRLAHFSKIRWGGAFACESPKKCWELKSGVIDNLDKRYLDWGSINSKKVGAALYDIFPDTAGTTGEKTGLCEYLSADGWGPLMYLQLWQKCKAVENLVKTGQASLVAGIVRAAYRFSSNVLAEAEKYLDLKEVKPHRMLRINKEDFRQLKKRNIELKVDDFDLYKQYSHAGGKLSLLDMLKLRSVFGKSGLSTAIELMYEYRGDDLDRQCRYMEKQGLKCSEIGLLLDTRRTAKELADGRALTHEQLWPSRLVATHDRLMRIKRDLEAAKNAAEKAKQEAGFIGVIERFGCLEWTDGELCVKLPVSAQDLIREGDILCHCVGGYSSAHVNGRDTIFFIRHYRRPERPYYTLDIDMTGRPVERQLHGYGNERHGPHKQYAHGIPKKVRSFCDRWKNEILIPWYVEQQKNKEVKSA